MNELADVKVTLESPREGMSLPCLVSNRGNVAPLDVLFGDDVDFLHELQEGPNGKGRAWERAALFEGRYFWVELFYAPDHADGAGSYGIKVIGPLVASLATSGIDISGLKVWSRDGESWWDEVSSFVYREELFLGRTEGPTVTVATEFRGIGHSAGPVLLGVEPVEDFYAPGHIYGVRLLEAFDGECPFEPTGDEADQTIVSVLGNEYAAVRLKHDEESPEPYRIRVQGPLNRGLLQKFAVMDRDSALFRSRDGENWCGRITRSGRISHPEVRFD